MENEQHTEGAAKPVVPHAPAPLHVDTNVIDSFEWGQVTIPEESLDDLITFTGLTRDECLARLSSYSLEGMAKVWQETAPKTPEEIRAYYATLDAYIWELTIWHNTPAYAPYLKAVDALAQRQGAGCRALDYGSGIGTAAIRLAERGYDVTIADVPGVTFEFAQHRLRRRGIPFKAIGITTDFPDLDGTFDAIVCFDVLEHVPNPDKVLLSLGNHLSRNSLMSVVASFDVQDERAGYHLRENYLKWGGGRWNLFLSGHGYRWLGDMVYGRSTGLNRSARLLQYRLWRLTGLDLRPTGIHYKRRTIRA